MGSDLDRRRILREFKVLGKCLDTYDVRSFPNFLIYVGSYRVLIFLKIGKIGNVGTSYSKSQFKSQSSVKQSSARALCPIEENDTDLERAR